MRRLLRNLTQGADLARLLWVSCLYGRSERTERRFPSLDQMTDDRLAAESRLRRRSS